MTLPMVKCSGCGFHVEQREVLDWDEGDHTTPEHRTSCGRCSTHCTPDVREAYRRGFNAGLDAMAESVVHTAKNSALRKRGDR